VHGQQDFLHQILDIARLLVQTPPQKTAQVRTQVRQETPVGRLVAAQTREQQRLQVLLFPLQASVIVSSLHRRPGLHEKRIYVARILRRYAAILTNGTGIDSALGASRPRVLTIADSRAAYAETPARSLSPKKFSAAVTALARAAN
jgi:hypothetical protein